MPSVYNHLSHGDGKRYFAISQINIRVLDWVLFWIFDSSFEEWIIEMINEIKFAIMNSLMHSWQERLSCFDCKKTVFVSIYIINRTLHGLLGIRILSSRADSSKIKFISPCGHIISVVNGIGMDGNQSESRIWHTWLILTNQRTHSSLTWSRKCTEVSSYDFIAMETVMQCFFVMEMFAYS